MAGHDDGGRPPRAGGDGAPFIPRGGPAGGSGGSSVASGGRSRLPDDDQFPEDQFIKVSAFGNVKSIAGKIAHSCREGEPPAMLTTGANCVNQVSWEPGWAVHSGCHA